MQHTHTHKNAHVHTEVDKCTNSPVHVMHISVKQFQQPIQYSFIQCVCVCVCVTGIKLLLPWKLIECLRVTCGTWCAAMAESFLGSGMQRRLWCASFLSYVLRIPKKINLSVIAANLRVPESNLIIMREYQQVSVGLLFFVCLFNWWIGLLLHHQDRFAVSSRTPSKIIPTAA